MVPPAANSGEPIIVGERTELSKPLHRVPPIPEPEAHKKLRAALKRRGMSDRVAGAISTIWTDPGAVLPQVVNPQRRRIPGAYLEFISGTVYTARLLPDPLNPRNSDLVPFALAQVPDAPPATLAPAVQDGVGELAVHIESRDALIHQVNWAIETTRRDNSPMPDIAEQGIMDPPIGVATTVYYDGTDEAPTAHIVVREGSSRISHGLDHVGVTAEDILFSLARSSSSMRAHIDQINSYISKPVEDILPVEKAAIRCAVTEFELIIDVVPDVPGAVDLSQAIKARVAQDHLNAKKRWTDPARHTTLAEECLIAAREAGVIPTDDDADWLGGRLTPKEAESKKIVPFGDERAARAVHLFMTPDKNIRNAVRRPIALVLINEPNDGSRQRARVTHKAKLPLAVELIVREKRGAVSDRELERFRSTLSEALPQDLYKSWWSPTERSPEELYRAALAEIRDGDGTRLAGTELWVRAAYVLAKHNAIGGPRHDEGAGSDRRKPGAVMEALAETEQGLRHLRQVVEDDRDGIAPRQVDAHGQPRKDGEGNDLAIDNGFLRTKLAPKDGQPSQPPDPERAVQEHYKHAVKETKEALRRLGKEMRNLAGLKDGNGVPLIEKEGRAHSRLLKDTLQQLAAEAEDLWERAVEAQGPNSPFVDEEDDEEDA